MTCTMGAGPEKNERSIISGESFITIILIHTSESLSRNFDFAISFGSGY